MEGHDLCAIKAVDVGKVLLEQWDATTETAANPTDIACEGVEGIHRRCLVDASVIECI